jgi:DNA primase small subunit
MPHSTSQESTPAGDESRTVSQVDDASRTISQVDDASRDISQAAADSPDQDVAMADADEDGEKKVNLEDLFDDEDSDEEFPSSGPGVKSESEPSPPAPVYALSLPPGKSHCSQSLET